MHNKKVGYVTEVTNSADKGKSLILIPTTVYLLVECGYKLENVHANFDIYLDGVWRHDNDSIRQYVRDMCRKHYREKIILVDEANGVWGHRDYDTKEQKEDLKGIWQTTKLGNWLIYTNHLGKGVDKNLRDATQIIVAPEYDEVNDTVECKIVNGIYLTFPIRTFQHVSDYFNIYDRWQPLYSEGGKEYQMKGFGDNCEPRWED